MIKVCVLYVRCCCFIRCLDYFCDFFFFDKQTNLSDDDYFGIVGKMCAWSKKNDRNVLEIIYENAFCYKVSSCQ